jgi:hypothetical protein
MRGDAERAVGSRVSLILADHRSLTFSEQPTLYWFTSGHVEQVEHLLYEGDALRPLLHETIRSVPSAGMHALPLTRFGIRLKPDVPYRWVAILTPEGPGKEVTQLSGEVMHVVPTPDTARKTIEAPPDARPAILGAVGAWCDLIDALTDRAANSTDHPKWLGYRARVLRQVGLVDAARADEARLPLRVSLTAPRSRYQAGDVVRLSFEGNKRFFARLIYVDADGNYLQILPNARRSDNVFEGHTANRFPGEFDQPLIVSAPFGRERVILQASAEPLKPITGRVLPNGFVLLSPDTARQALAAPNIDRHVLDIITEPRQ